MLIFNIQKLERAYDLTGCCNELAVWSLLAKAQLDEGVSMLKESIDSYIKADNPTTFTKVIVCPSVSLSASAYHKTFVVLVVHNQSANNYCPSWFALQSSQFKLPVFPLSEQIWHFYCFYQNLLKFINYST